MTWSESTFDKDIKDLHLIYNYDAKNVETGEPEKWKYEMWFFSYNRIVPGSDVSVHKARRALETGTICSLVYDIKNDTITTLLGFSKGYWEKAEEAHGDKRNKSDLERWRGLAKIGSQVDRFMLSEQATIAEKFHGKGNLEPIDESWPTL